jgi:putative ABC transport system permease protein
MIKTIIHPRIRFVLTILGIALCAILMLFLLAIYRGASEGSVGYVRESRADLWILQKHSTNILRSSSLLPASIGLIIQKVDGIESAAPVFFILSSVNTAKGPATLYLTGYDIKTGIGGPPDIFKGNSVTKDNEIVLDRSFASKYNINIGDNLYVKDDTLKVAGLSSGTNMFVIQYAFISLQKAHEIVGYPFLVSCFQVKLKPDADPAGIIKNLMDRISDIAVFDQKTFLNNNKREMESGILPLLYTVAFIGAIVLTAILSLILSMHVLERRNDYAIMKALGAPAGFLPTLIIKQAIVLSFCGMIAATVFFFPLLHFVEKLSPEIAGKSSFWQIVLVLTGTGIICLVSSVIPIGKLRKIYPLDVFK